MSDWKRNLPNEHGAWVLIFVGLLVGVAANPGVWQLLAVPAWLGLFFVRVPFSRILDGKHGGWEWGLTLVAGGIAFAGFLVLGFVNPRIDAWLAVALIPGAVLIIFRRRRFMRSIVGEMLSAVIMTPIIPSIAVAGREPVSTRTAIYLAVAMVIYMVASVFRVRAVARTGRNKATPVAIALGTALLPLAVAAAWAVGYWTWVLALATLPAILIGWALAFYASRRKIALMVVGVYETVAVLAFVAGLVVDLHACVV